MTAPDAPASGDTAPDATTETPGYVSPTEQLLRALPFGAFRELAERMSNTGSGGKGGQFEFSVAEMGELHKQFAAEASALETMWEKSINASHDLQALANDPASRAHYKRAREHFGMLRGTVKQQLTFAEGFRDAVGAAIGLKNENESSIGQTMKNIGSKVV